MIGQAGARWREQVLELATERFGRMLAEEAGKIRVEMANLRSEMKGDIGDLRADLIKWSFAFWIGEVAVILGLVAFLVRR